MNQPLPTFRILLPTKPYGHYVRKHLIHHPNIVCPLYLLDIANLYQLVDRNIELLLLCPRIFPHPNKRVQCYLPWQYSFRIQPQLFLPEDINNLFLVRRI